MRLGYYLPLILVLNVEAGDRLDEPDEFASLPSLTMSQALAGYGEQPDEFTSLPRLTMSQALAGYGEQPDEFTSLPRLTMSQALASYGEQPDEFTSLPRLTMSQALAGYGEQPDEFTSLPRLTMSQALAGYGEQPDEFASLPSLSGQNLGQNLNGGSIEPLDIGYYTYGSVGLSFASQLGARSSEYVKNNAPALDVATDPFVFPEWTLGFIAKRKIALGWRSMLQLAYREMEKEVSAQNIRHEYQRVAYSLDFLESFSYQQGFVPYVGISWNLEQLEFYPEIPAQEASPATRTYHHFGFVGGWDILPHPHSRWFIRSNFRWYPDTSLSYQGQRVSFPNFEISLIQLVVRFN